jgi:predicted RNA-binding Zn ribbon-like protein
MGAPRLDESLIFAAGRLSLDFVNTACMRLGVPLELLGDREDLDRWLRLAERAFGKPEGVWAAADEGSLGRALELRAALRELVDAARGGRSPASASVQAVNEVLRGRPSFVQIELLAEGLGQSVHPVIEGDAWLGEIARDAADLLATGDLTLLRECECATCVRVFYDTTKNHRRRWCVEKCGSRVKAANYYRRKREAAKASP